MARVAFAGSLGRRTKRCSRPAGHDGFLDVQSSRPRRLLSFRETLIYSVSSFP